MRRNRIFGKFIKLTSITVIFVFVFGLFLKTPVQAAGASLFLTPSTGTHVINTKFSVSVKVNSGGVVINAAEGSISFDNKSLEITGISKGGSIFTLWTAEPTYSNSAGTISFGGGIPRPGYKGSSGHICTITFKAKKAGTAAVRFTSGAVLANDGMGTNILASMGSGSYTISPEVTAPKPTKEENEQPKQTEEKPVEAEYNKPVITSPTHPDQNLWYNKNTATFTWTPPTGVTGVSFVLDQAPSTEPGDKSDGVISEKQFTDIADGKWYFHLKYKDSKRWGTTAHYRIMVDTKPPQVFEVTVKEAPLGDWPELAFQTTDDGSGMDRYEILVGNLEASPTILKPEEQSYKTSGLVVGDHTALVKAIDKAGNERVVTSVFKILPIEAPKIINYPTEIKSSDQFFVNGTAVPSCKINIYIEKDGVTFATGTVPSDAGGNWFYVHEKGLSNGRYTAWAEAINDKGIQSQPSAKVSFLVTPPIFTRIGSFVINYFTVMVSLLFMIILIIILTIFLIGLIRRKLKKETVEVEDVLRKNFSGLEKMVDEEFNNLKSPASAKVRDNIKEHLDTAEKKILKEIKDVEDILK